MAPATGRAPAAVTPDLSVVVPSVNGLDALLECLAALRLNAASGVVLEVLVVDRCGEDVRRAVRDRFPTVVVLSVPTRTPIPHMRALAFRCAQADAVAVIEDHVLVSPGWARQLLDALAEGHDVVGGSVDNAASTHVVDWAAFLCEYSHLTPPLAGGETDTLAGNNVVYRRTLLEKYATAASEGRWEDHLHRAMRRDGIALRCRPEICVRHKMHYRVRDYVTQRYLYARAYAGLRRLDMGAARRVSFCMGTAVLPAVLLFRIIRRVILNSRYRGHLVLSLPLLILFVSAWAAGEAVGYAAGPGDALSRIR
jgi:glycosyltransferase involved in cell wall biosynthesis